MLFFPFFFFLLSLFSSLLWATKQGRISLSLPLFLSSLPGSNISSFFSRFNVNWKLHGLRKNDGRMNICESKSLNCETRSNLWWRREREREREGRDPVRNGRFKLMSYIKVKIIDCGGKKNYIRTRFVEPANGSTINVN